MDHEEYVLRILELTDQAERFALKSAANDTRPERHRVAARICNYLRKLK